MRSILFVLGQFGSIAVLLFCGSWALPWWSWLFFISGLLLFMWACVSLGGRNFTILPDPREGNTLSQRGIYRFLRHPMYTAVLLCGIAVSFGAPSLWRWIALGTCLVVLVLKVLYEEGELSAKHPGYRQVMRGVPRLFPGIW
ncbi:MAG: isoprenylcysteine carboxylmethyltransferase family protein [Flavobacteriales bacterium]|nr:isoprenylcysteine carboxylmethyltransferase family protein [Flavobacteriales bacterium]